MNSALAYSKRGVLVTGLFLLFISPASAVTWVEGGGRSCDAACNRKHMEPFTTGNHTNGRPFMVCMDGQTSRPGYNLKPDWANRCYVGIGGKEFGAPDYMCLCK